MAKRLMKPGALALCAAVVCCGCGGFYSPGMLGKGEGLRSPLTPPSQEGIDNDHWKVETDISLYHFSHGEGAPVLVVHGGPGIPPYQPWKGLEAIDGLRCQFYYYHQRGCGNSTHPVDRFISRNYYRNMVALDGLLGMSAQLADIERIRRILGVEKITLIGHSYGGLLAALYAIEYPDRVEKLVLVSPAATITMPPLEGGRDRVRQYLPDAEKKRYDDFLKHYFDYGKIFSKSETELAALNGEYARYYVKALENAGVHVPEPISRLNGIGGWMVHALYLAAGRKYDYRLLLRRIQAPTLVVHGSRDIVPESVSRAYADGIPGARFEVLPGASHFAYDECPDEFAQAVGGFLEG